MKEAEKKQLKYFGDIKTFYCYKNYASRKSSREGEAVVNELKECNRRYANAVCKDVKPKEKK